MKHVILLISAIFIFGSAQAQQKAEQAREKAARLQAIKAAVNDYQAKKQLDQMFAAKFKTAGARDAVNCPPPDSGASCIDAVCSKLSSLACDDKWELEEYAGICKGNIGGGCINAICPKLSSLACDDKWELVEIAGFCKGNIGGGCINTVCSKLSSLACDDKWELEEISGMCKGVEGSCMESVCSKLSSLACDDKWELEDVAKTCATL